MFFLCVGTCPEAKAHTNRSKEEKKRTTSKNRPSTALCSSCSALASSDNSIQQQLKRILGDVTIDGYGQSMAASNDGATPMHMDDNMFGRSRCMYPSLIVVTNVDLSHNDAFGPVFPGAKPSTTNAWSTSLD